MSVHAPKREHAERMLRSVVTDLRSRIDTGDLDGLQMILGCRRVLDLWIASGGDSLDDPIVGFLGIECQCDHVLGGSQVRVGRDVDHVRFAAGSDAEKVEIAELGRFFKESFERVVEDLAGHLNVN